MADLLAALEALSVIAPDLVASELRPVVASLQARRRTCHRCGRDYVSKSMTLRARFCSKACRKVEGRKAGRLAPHLLTDAEAQP